MLYTNPILNQFFLQVQKSPNKLSIIETSGNKINLKELNDKSLDLATNLSEQGFKKGDRVLILVRPSIELVVFILAVMRLGGVVVVADPGMGTDVFSSRVTLAHPQWVFGESIVFAIQHHPLLKYALRRKGIDVPEINGLKNCKKIRLGPPLPNCFTTLSYDTLLASHKKDNQPFQNLRDSDEAMIVFTSGTTNVPKAVVHTVKSLSSTIDLLVDICHPKPDDIFNASLPHFLLLAVGLGVTAILTKKSMTPAQYFQNLKVYKPTVLFGPPAEFIELINYCRESHQQCPSFIRKIFLGSAPVLSGFLQKLVTYTHGSTEITCLYGMTEVLPIAVVDGRYKAAWKGEGDLLGQWVKGITPQILKDGELEVQSPHMFYKYLGQEKSQWVSTGDLVKIQKKELILMGRKKDMIIKGNYNIYPELYESTIQKIPGVAACAMVGIQDITLQDEKIILVVEPETQSDINIKKRIQDALRSGPYSIDSHAYPDDILIMKIPRSGRQLKINKKTLRALLIDKI